MIFLEKYTLQIMFIILLQHFKNNLIEQRKNGKEPVLFGEWDSPRYYFSFWFSAFSKLFSRSMNYLSKGKTNLI